MNQLEHRDFVEPNQAVIIDVNGLARLLYRTPATLLEDRVRRPDSLPPALLPPGSRKPLWIVDDVIRWLREHPDLTKPGQRRRPQQGE